MVHDLISAYGLETGFSIVAPEPATEDDLRLFHSSNYVDYLKSQNDTDDTLNESGCLDNTNETSDVEDEDEDQYQEHGIGNQWCYLFCSLILI